MFTIPLRRRFTEDRAGRFSMRFLAIVFIRIQDRTALCKTRVSRDGKLPVYL